MSIFCLNCRGLGDPRAVKELRVALRRYSPTLIFLSETKRSMTEMSVIKNKLGDYDGIFVDCRGRAGGLALLWDKANSITLLSYSMHHIDIRVEELGSRSPWRFTGIYGWPEGGNKVLTCDLLRDLTGHYNLPWLVGGDFNEVLFNFEKRGGSA